MKIPSQANAPVPKRQLKTYAVEERGPFVFIWMGDSEPDYSRFPDVPQLGNPGLPGIHGFYELKGSYLFMLENLYDLTHFVYLHRNTFDFDDSYYDIPPITTVTERRLGREHQLRGGLPQRPDVAAAARQERSWPARPSPNGTTPSPFLRALVLAHWYVLVDGQDEPTKESVQGYINHYMTPVTKDTCLYWWSYSINRDVHNDEHFAGMTMFIKTGFAEDVVAVEHMQKLLDEDTTDVEEMNIAGDKAGILFRRVILKWAKDEYGADVPDDEVEVPLALVREPSLHDQQHPGVHPNAAALQPLVRRGNGGRVQSQADGEDASGAVDRVLSHRGRRASGLSESMLAPLIPLSEGIVDGDNLVCSYHGVCYSSDGVVARIPSQANAPVPKRQLKRYPVEERGPLVFIWMGDGEADYSRFPDLPQLANPEFRVLHGFFELKGSYLFMLENLYDLTHFVFLHRQTFKIPESFYDNPPITTVTADGLVCCTNPEDSREAILKPLPPIVREELEGSDDQTARRQHRNRAGHRPGAHLRHA